MAREQIGTVEIKRVRVYPLDPWSDTVTGRSEVIVKPGTYPVFRDGISHYWRMDGVLDHQSYRMGDGMFAIHTGDVVSDDDVVFYSMRYGPDEWEALVAGFASDTNPALVFSVGAL